MIVEFPNDARINFDISIHTDNHADRVLIQEVQGSTHDYYVAIFLTDFDTEKMQRARAIALQAIKNHKRTGTDGNIFFNGAV